MYHTKMFLVDWNPLILKYPHQELYKNPASTETSIRLYKCIVVVIIIYNL